jgi:hypothetical protein
LERWDPGWRLLFFFLGIEQANRKVTLALPLSAAENTDGEFLSSILSPSTRENHSPFILEYPPWGK